MKVRNIAFVITLFVTANILAQTTTPPATTTTTTTPLSGQKGVKIADHEGAPLECAILEMESINKGLLLPRIANLASIVNPTDGLLVYLKDPESSNGKIVHPI